MLPEMIATWAICTGCAIRFFNARSARKLAVAFAAFVFCGVNFALTVYPPYQISLLYLGLGVLVGKWFQSRNEKTPWRTIRGILLTAGGIVVIALILVPFWMDVRATLSIIADTTYPGARRSTGGELSMFKLLSGFFEFFQSEDRFPRIYENASEASNFYPLWLAVAALVAFQWRQIKTIPPMVIALGIVLLVLGLYCVLPLPQWVLSSSLLGFATERRTLLTIGIANIILCCVFLDRGRTIVLTKSAALAAFGISFATIAFLWWLTSRATPNIFTHNRQLLLALISNAVIRRCSFGTNCASGL